MQFNTIFWLFNW